MPDQVALAIAAAMAGKGAEALITGGKDAVAAIARFVRERFGRGTAEEAALRAAITDPDLPGRQELLVRTLDRLMSDDPAVADRLRAWWRETSAAQDRRDVVVNCFTGQAHAVIQTREVHGDIRL